MKQEFVRIITAFIMMISTIVIFDGCSKAQLAARTYQRVSGTVVDQYEETNGDGSSARFISVIEYNDQKYAIINDKFYMLYSVEDEVQFNIVNYYNDEGIIVNTLAKTIEGSLIGVNINDKPKGESN